jgi:5-methylcytosine-specific restriction enzyme A
MGQHGRLYASKQWKQLRAVQLARFPLCAQCMMRKKYVPATVVHHIRKHEGNWKLFNDPNNLQSVCKPCHDGTLQQEEKRGYTGVVGADGWPIDPKHPANKT